MLDVVDTIGHVETRERDVKQAEKALRLTERALSTPSPEACQAFDAALTTYQTALTQAAESLTPYRVAILGEKAGTR